MTTTLPRLSGSDGLSNAVLAALSSGPASHTLLVFDFDRTLTNGFSKPGDELHLAKVVRGGEKTVAALKQAHDAGVGLFIITARRPSISSIQQLFASMDNAQNALSPFFDRGDCVEEFRFGEDENNVPLARGGSIYASGYQKAHALAHIISEQKQDGLHIFFFDDSIVNSYEVGTSMAQHLVKKKLAPSVVELVSYWWDSYEEEMGCSPTMSLSSFGNSDSNYAEYVKHMLIAYGVTSAQRNARIAAYRAAGNTRCSAKNTRGVVGAELEKVIAASKASRAKMNKISETLGTHFARGPLHGNNIRTAKKTNRKINNNLGALISKHRHIHPPPCPSSSTNVGWREKAAAKKAQTEAFVSIFKKQSALLLPPGPLEKPRWESAFLIEQPDEGSTGGVAFIVTLAGAFVIKATENVAEEYFGTEFLRKAGVPVPQTRVVFPTDTEHASILAAIEEVAKQYSRRGDSEGAASIMVNVFVAMTRYSRPLLLLEFVPAALSLGTMSEDTIKLLLEPQLAVEEARARARLEAMGRIWVLDAVLSFRDRFSSRLSNSNYDTAVAYVEGKLDSWGTISRNDAKELMMGNLGNVLLTNAPFYGSSSPLVAAGIAAVDSHVKLVCGTASVAPTLAKARTEGRAQLYANLTTLIEEATKILDKSSIKSIKRGVIMDWLRFTIKHASGHSLSDIALAAARLGALRAISAVPAAVKWARSELAAAREGDVGDTTWQTALACIDESALVEVGRTFECLIAEHAEFLEKLPPPPSVGNNLVGEKGSLRLAEEAKLIRAELPLWIALSSELREVLLDERVHGVRSNSSHSMEWPGW